MSPLYCSLIVAAGALVWATAGAEEPAPPAEKPAIKRVQGRSGFFERLPPRAERTTEERQAKVAELRTAYTKPTAEWPAPLIDEGAAWKELGLLPLPEAARPTKPRTVDPKVQLGHTLFFDPRLSASQEMACASCHDPDLAWADGRTVSFGLGRSALKRNSPSLLNAQFMETLFWDGRASSLEDQARQVLLNKQEMGSSEQLLKERLSPHAGYQRQFTAAFGDAEVTLDRVATSLAAFERTLVGGRSSFDAFLKGKSEALSDSALLGLDLFRREARCLHCHNGPMLTDGQLHDVGLSYFGRKYEDLGRYTVTSHNGDAGKFRTPSLRNVSRTRPYMHNGLFDLPGVLNMYNAGMPTLTPKPDQVGDPKFPKKSPHLKPLGLNKQDLQDLLAFLEALEEPPLRVRPLPLPGIDPDPPEAPAAEDSTP
jgi:cytochrome c peroxidase